MISVRSETPELAGTRLLGFATNNPGSWGTSVRETETLIEKCAGYQPRRFGEGNARPHAG